MSTDSEENLRGPSGRRKVKTGLVALIAFIVALIAFVASLANIGSFLQEQGVLRPFMSVSSVSARAGATSTASVTATPQKPAETFQPSKPYVYDDIIGHSNVTPLTNSDVTVILESLTVNTSGGKTLLVIGFHDYDNQKGTKFAFSTLLHVYFIDNQDHKYQALSAVPSQVDLQPQQSETLQVTFPSLPATVTWLDLHFNTDFGALDTPCVKLTPTEEFPTC